MTDLDLLKAELARQDEELGTCFEQMRSLDPELTISVSPEWMDELSADPTPVLAPAPWAVRG